MNGLRSVKMGFQIRALLLTVLLTIVSQAEPLATRALADSTVSVDVYLTSVEDKKKSPAWCYRTSGLKPMELSLTLLIAPNEEQSAFPEAPIDLLENLASRGDELKPGILEVGAPFLGAEVAGLLLVPEDPLNGAPVNALGLAVVAVSQNELQVAKHAGVSRLLGGLANQARYYPCPVWSERSRPSSFSEANIQAMKESPLSQIRLVHTGASVLDADGTLSLRMKAADARAVSEEMLANNVVRLSLQIDPRANAFLIWTPDQSAPAAVTPPGSDGTMMAAQYLLLVSDREESSGRLGDGYAVVLPPTKFEELAKALASGSDFTTTVAGGKPSRFSLEWVRTTYHSPLDGSIHYSEEGWVTYNPTEKSPQGSVAIKEVILLTPEPLLGRAIKTDELAALIEDLSALAESQLESLRGEELLEVVLQCDLGAEKKYRIAINPPPVGAQMAIDEFFAKLAKIKLPRVNGPVKFHLLLAIKPASGSSTTSENQQMNSETLHSSLTEAVEFLVALMGDSFLPGVT